MKYFPRKCFAPYSEEVEDKAPYTPTHRKFTDDSAWTYQSPEELDTGSYDGEVTTPGQARPTPDFTSH